MRLRVLGALTVSVWVAVLSFSFLVALRVSALSESVEGIQSVAAETDRLRVGVEAAESRWDEMRRQADLPIPPKPMPNAAQGPRHYTRAQYEAELASDLSRCDPDWMLLYERTVPAFFYRERSPFRSAVVEVLDRSPFGAKWYRAAKRDAGSQDEEKVVDRVTRMAAACVAMYFDNDILRAGPVDDPP